MDREKCSKYETVLADFEARKADLSAELAQVETVIASLKTAMSGQTADLRSTVKPLPFPTPIGNAAAPNEVPASQRYAGISVRWAVLCLMAEHATEPMPTVDIAAALQEGGTRSAGQNFVANVSAVVSDMAKNRFELSVEEGTSGAAKYQITQKGRDAWQTIKRSRSYRFRRNYGQAAHA